MRSLPIQHADLRPTTLAPRMQASFFSTTLIPRNTTGGPNPTSPNPSYPTFSFKRISPNPRVRAALAVGLLAMAAAEGYMCVKYWPKITGKERKAGEE